MAMQWGLSFHYYWHPSASGIVFQQTDNIIPEIAFEKARPPPTSVFKFGR
jgi:hypothetical protein